MSRAAILNVVGLTPRLIGDHTPNLRAFLEKHPPARIRPAFPAVTCTAQSSMLTGRPVSQPSGQPNTLHHGWVTNTDPAPTATPHNSGNLNVPYLYENGGKVVLNWNWLDNDWNGNNPALRHATRSFLLGFGWGVLFGQLPAPTAQISADFIEAYR